MFNVSAFELPDLGDDSDQVIEGADSHAMWEILTAALVPLLVLVVAVCLLVRQNLQLASQAAGLNHRCRRGRGRGRVAHLWGSA